jgi:hypothetical protein
MLFVSGQVGMDRDGNVPQDAFGRDLVYGPGVGSGLLFAPGSETICMTMEGFGAAGLGLLIGWLLPSARVVGDRAAVWSAGMLAIVALTIGYGYGFGAAGVATAAALTAAFAHRAWREELRRRYGNTRREGYIR